MSDLLVSSSFSMQRFSSLVSCLLLLPKQHGRGTGFSTEISHSPTTASAVIVPLIASAVSALFAVSHCHITALDATYHWTTALSICGDFQ